MSAFGSTGALREQAKRVGTRATGATYYVDSVNGIDGNPGDRLHPVKTLTQALTLASSGDRIQLVPGGSETVTVSLSVAVEDLEIVCDAAHPASGFTVSGAGTLDLMAISAADALVRGVQFSHTGAASDSAGVRLTAAAHRSVIEGCRYNGTAVTTPAGFGVEVTSGADDVKVRACEFLDALYGVYVVAASTAESDRLEVDDCDFYVGLSTAFGFYAPQATGKLQGLRLLNSRFIEADGDGSAAAAAWDGTNGENATQGPLKIGADVDQYLIASCQASTAASVLFENLAYVTTGAAGEIVECYTATTSSITTVASDTVVIESDTTVIESDTKVIESDLIVVASDLLQVYSDTTIIASDLVQIYSDTTAIATSVATYSSDLTAIESELVVVHSETTVIASDVIVISSDLLQVYSDTTIIASDLVIVASDLLQVYSDTTTIASDLVIIASDLLQVHSDTTIIYSDITIIVSDLLIAASDVVVLDAWDVRTVAKVDLALDGGTVADVFTVANGPIELISLALHVTEAVSADACAAKWQSDPTIGAASPDMCGTVDIASAAIGDVFFIDTGAHDGAMVKAVNATGVARVIDRHQLIMPGGIDLNLANTDPSTGIATAYLTYRPLALMAVVTAA